MSSKYVEGYTSEAEFCPYCGGEIDTQYANGSQACMECGRRFFIVEDDGDEDC